MGGANSSTSSSRVVSAPYENNVRWSDPQVRNLLSNLTENLQTRLTREGNAIGDNLNTTSQNTLMALQGNDYQYKENPYTRAATDALEAQAYSNFQKNFAKAYSDVQGYGQGTASRRLADTYSDYANQAALQQAQTKLGQYNTDLDRVLKSAELGLGQDTLSQLSPMIVGLGNLFKETYGKTPATESSSKSWGFNIF